MRIRSLVVAAAVVALAGCSSLDAPWAGGDAGGDGGSGSSEARAAWADAQGEWCVPFGGCLRIDGQRLELDGERYDLGAPAREQSGCWAAPIADGPAPQLVYCPAGADAEAYGQGPSLPLTESVVLPGLGDEPYSR